MAFRLSPYLQILNPTCTLEKQMLKVLTSFVKIIISARHEKLWTLYYGSAEQAYRIPE